MEFGSIFGVPAHPLFVHVPVVLTPLALIAALAMFRTEWRKTLAWVTAALAGVAALGAQLAVGSGEELEERVEESRALEMHVELGEVTRTLIVVFFIVAVVLLAYLYFSARTGATGGTIATALTVAVVLSGTLATIWVARAGHQGAQVTWDDIGTGPELEH